MGHVLAQSQGNQIWGAEISYLGLSVRVTGFLMLVLELSGLERSRQLAVEPWSHGTGDGRKKWSEFCQTRIPESSGG